LRVSTSENLSESSFPRRIQTHPRSTYPIQRTLDVSHRRLIC
jgi:hypothetical protein